MASNIKVIRQIKEMIEECACNPDDYDLTKTAVEIYDLVEANLPHYDEPSWAHNQNLGGVK